MFCCVQNKHEDPLVYPNSLLHSLVLVKALGDLCQPNSLANVMCHGTSKTVSVKQRKNSTIHHSWKRSYPNNLMSATMPTMLADKFHIFLPCMCIVLCDLFSQFVAVSMSPAVPMSTSWTCAHFQLHVLSGSSSVELSSPINEAALRWPRSKSGRQWYGSTVIETGIWFPCRNQRQFSPVFH